MNEPVNVGATVDDLGCRVMQQARITNPAYYPAITCRVVKVFDWGLRVARIDDPGDQWDCEYWITHLLRERYFYK